MRLTKSAIICAVCVILCLQTRRDLARGDATAYQNDPTHDGAATFDNFDPIPTPLWSANVGGPFAYPLIVGNHVFVDAANSLRAYDAASGSLAWNVPALNQHGFSPGYAPTYDNGKIFAVGGIYPTFSLTAYSATSGASLWTNVLPGQYSFSSPSTASGGSVYVGGSGSGGTLYAVDEGNGALRWTGFVENGDNSSPAVTNDGVYVSYAGPQTYKFNPTTGAQIWHYASSVEGGGGSTPVYANGKVFVSDLFSPYNNNNNLMAINAATGQFIYTAVNGFSISMAPPAFYNGIGYLSYGTTLEAFDPSTGSIKWSTQFSDGSTSMTAPLVVNGFVYEDSSAGKLYVVDGSSGATVDTVNLESAGSTAGFGFYDSMAAANGLLAVPNGQTLEVFALPEPAGAMVLMLCGLLSLRRLART